MNGSPTLRLRPTSRTLPRRRFLTAVAVAAGATALAACGEPGEPGPSGDGGKIEILLREPLTLDPALASAPNEFTILNALFEPLITVGGDGLPVPAAAASWDVSNAGHTITFTLRPDAQWMTGEPVTADAFAWAWRRNLSPQIGGAFNYLLFPVLGARDYAYGLTPSTEGIGVSAPDDSTLRVHLAEPSPGFPARVAAPTFFPLPEGEIRSYGSAWTRPRTLRSNGQYQLAQLDEGRGMTLFRNEHYWGEPGGFREVIVRFPQEDGSPLLAFRSGTVDVAPVRGAAYRSARADDQLRERLRLFERAGTWFLVFNTTKPPWDRVEVRRALSMVLDRGEMAAAVFEEPTLPGWSIVPPSILPRDLPQPAPDVAGARELLTQAGFPNGDGLPPLRFTFHTTDSWKRLAAYLAATWRETLGVEVAHDERSWRDFLSFTDDPGDFDLYRGGWTSEFADPANWYDALWVSEVDYLGAGWRNADFDRHVREAGAATDPAARRSAYREADAVLEAEQPAIGIGHHADAYLLHPRITGFGLEAVTGAIDLRAVIASDAS